MNTEETAARDNTGEGVRPNCDGVWQCTYEEYCEVFIFRGMQLYQDGHRINVYGGRWEQLGAPFKCEECKQVHSSVNVRSFPSFPDAVVYKLLCSTCEERRAAFDDLDG